MWIPCDNKIQKKEGPGSIMPFPRILASEALIQLACNSVDSCEKYHSFSAQKSEVCTIPLVLFHTSELNSNSYHLIMATSMSEVSSLILRLYHVSPKQVFKSRTTVTSWYERVILIQGSQFVM